MLSMISLLHQNTRSQRRIATSISKPTKPFWTINSALPSQNRSVIAAESTADPINTVRHHSWFKRNPTPPATKPTVATKKRRLAIALVVLSPRISVKIHDLPVQPISGWKGTRRWLKVKYQIWTRPCKIMKTPMSNLTT